MRNFGLKRALNRLLRMSDKSPKGIRKEDSSSDSEDAGASGGPPRGIGMSVDALRKYLSEKLGFSDSDDEAKERIKVLDDVSVDGIVDYIKAKKCKNIITMAGAGISTSAGIPDFRSPGTGLYDNLQKYNLPHPQAIFELSFFHENPKPFFVLAKELYPGSFRPTISHYFVKLLIDKGVLLRHYSQNIDTLERVAGIPEDKIVEAHGTFYTSHCVLCQKEYALEWMKEKIFNDQIPSCEKCEGVVKPDIVFFGEALPYKFYHLTDSDFKQCDLLIVLGSSLAVQPFASLVERVPDICPRLLINREKAGHRTGIMAMMGMGGGMDFDGKHNTRDVAWLGDCDEGCQLLADKLGWGEDLKALREESIKKIEEEEAKAQKKDDEKNDRSKEKEEDGKNSVKSSI